MSDRPDNPDPADAALDQLLAMARWPEPTAGLQGNVVSTIRAERLRHRRFMLIRNTSAIAACIALVTASLWLMLHGDRSVQPKIVAHSSSPDVVVELPGRAPTRYEQWFIAHMPVQAVVTVQQIPPPTPADPNTEIARILVGSDSLSVVAFIKGQEDEQVRRTMIVALLGRNGGIEPFIQLVRDASLRDSALAALKSMPDPPIDRLLAELRKPLIDNRQAAARALGSLCHGQILPLLQNMIETGDHRREALAVLGQCADAKAIEYVEFLNQRRSLASELQVVREEMKEMF